jgi:mono/diheme cytochrome c family protein
VSSTTGAARLRSRAPVADLARVAGVAGLARVTGHGRAASIVACLALAVALAGCGSSTPKRGSSTESAPAFATAPYTPQQELVAAGAKLVVTDGCAACHLNGSDPKLAPSFTSLAGHQVKLKDGGTAVVDERFLRKALLDPSSEELAGYPAAPMIAALRRLRFAQRPAAVSALVAFIEQVGPETE